MAKKKTDLVTNLDLEYLNGFTNAVKMLRQTVSVADGISFNGNLSAHEQAKQLYNAFISSYGAMERMAKEMRELMEQKFNLFYDETSHRYMIIQEVEEETKPEPKRRGRPPKKEKVENDGQV